MAADETATNYADITNQLIADAANAEAQRDAALGRVAELDGRVHVADEVVGRLGDDDQRLEVLGGVLEAREPL
eukprot:COSAG01_NODE_3065_length_6646_cov_13.181610_2_plen_73_part_00